MPLPLWPAAGLTPEFRAHLYASLIACLIACLFILLWVQEIRFSKSKLHAETFPLLHRVIHEIRDLHVAIRIGEVVSHRDAAQRLRAILNKTSKIYSIITGTNCRVCIKTISYRGTHDVAKLVAQGKLNIEQLKSSLYVETPLRDDDTSEQEKIFDHSPHH